MLAAGCAARHPVLYQDARFTDDGPEVTSARVAECEAFAAQHDDPSPAPAIARDTAVGTLTGAVAGVVGGAIWGNPGTGAAAGAAGGAAAALFNSLLFRPHEPSPVYRTAVETCLADGGYRVIGWH